MSAATDDELEDVERRIRERKDIGAGGRVTEDSDSDFMPDQFQEIKRRKIAAQTIRERHDKMRKALKGMKERKEKVRGFGRKASERGKDGIGRDGMKKGRAERGEGRRRGKGAEEPGVGAGAGSARKEGDHEEGIARLLELVREKSGEHLVRPPPPPRKRRRKRD